MDQVQGKFDRITDACSEIEKALIQHLHATLTTKYKDEIERDLVTLSNIKHLVIAVTSDIESDKIGASTELLLRIAANEFKTRLTQIPEKKNTIREIIQLLHDIHRRVLAIL